jgi:hypothetical protein
METKPGYIKLPRELLAAPIAKQPQRLALFVHLLLMANREAKEWNGVRIERGQVVTSLRSLSMRCGLTVSGVRTALNGLCRDGIAQVSAKVGARPQSGGPAQVAAQGYTVVTLCNYDSYEGPAVEARTGSRTPQSETPAQVAAQVSAPTRENNIDILSIIEDPRFLEIVQEWAEYKREKKQAYKGRKGLTQFYNRLRELSGGDPGTARRIVSEAMAANYATIYAPKTPRASMPRPDTLGRVEVPEYTESNFKSTF